MSENTVTIELIQRAQGGDEYAMVEVIDAHVTLVESFITATLPDGAPTEDRDDLRQEARIAIMTAVMDYRTDSPATLTTFAYRRLQRAVKSAWVSMRPGLSSGSSTEERVRRALYATDTVEAAWEKVNEGRSSMRDRMTRPTFDAAVVAVRYPVSMEYTVRESNDYDGRDATTLADVTADPYASTMTERVEARMMVDQVFAGVSPRHEFVMRADYGIDVPVLESAEIGAHLDVTPARVRGIRRDALASAFRVLQA
ncbi:sigma factor [Streptomyces scopuliridis]|uniref:sigma factor n=1 Tax=Streptomyces scopuliridis TaxID=452529 RepID=UPI00369DF740